MSKLALFGNFLEPVGSASEKAIGRARALTGTAVSCGQPLARAAMVGVDLGSSTLSGLNSGPLAHGSVKKPWDSQPRLKTPLILSDFRDARL